MRLEQSVCGVVFEEFRVAHVGSYGIQLFVACLVGDFEDVGAVAGGAGGEAAS